MNKSNKLIVAAALGLALVQGAYAGEEIANLDAGVTANQTDTTLVSRSKFDADYVENGVHIIIPKILPKAVIKDGESALWNTYYGKELSLLMQDAYKNAGYSVAGGSIFRSGEYYHQFLVFSGNKEQFYKLNQYGAQAGANKTLFMRGVSAIYTVTAAVVGTKLGGLNVGSKAGDLALKNTTTNEQEIFSSFAIFDGYEGINAKDTDIIQVFAVTTGPARAQKKTRVVFVSENGVMDSDLITKTIMKAQNFSKE